MDDPLMPAARPKYTVAIHESPKFDLTSYIANYRGRTVYRRLYLIASCSTVLAEEAGRLAVLETKRGNDTQNYQDAVAILKKVTRGNDSLSTLDRDWLEKQEKQNAIETSRLEHELKGYKNNLIRESIRMGNEDLGSFYHSIGNLALATKAYSRMRDYCTTPSHIASTALRIILVAIEQSNWLAVQSQCHKIRNLQMKADEAARHQPKTSAALGLQSMCSGDYGDAATRFLAVEAAIGDSFNEVMTSNDIAVYGGLCALASMSRQELQTRVLDNTSFRNFLELEPHIRRAIGAFVNSKYSQCLEILESYRADYLLDLYLQPHVEEMYKRVRTKSIVEYVRPFSRVTLAEMAKVFGKSKTTTIFESANGASSNDSGSGQNIEDELIILIESRTLDAKIDLEARVLVAKESDVRAEMHEEALKMTDDFIREARLKILRMQAIAAGLEVKSTKGKGGTTGVDQWLNDEPLFTDAKSTGWSGGGGRGAGGGFAPMHQIPEFARGGASGGHRGGGRGGKGKLT